MDRRYMEYPKMVIPQTWVLAVANTYASVDGCLSRCTGVRQRNVSAPHATGRVRAMIAEGLARKRRLSQPSRSGQPSVDWGGVGAAGRPTSKADPPAPTLRTQSSQ